MRPSRLGKLAAAELARERHLRLEPEACRAGLERAAFRPVAGDGQPEAGWRAASDAMASSRNPTPLRGISRPANTIAGVARLAPGRKKLGIDAVGQDADRSLGAVRCAMARRLRLTANTPAASRQTRRADAAQQQGLQQPQAAIVARARPSRAGRPGRAAGRAATSRPARTGSPTSSGRGRTAARRERACAPARGADHPAQQLVGLPVVQVALADRQQMDRLPAPVGASRSHCRRRSRSRRCAGPAAAPARAGPARRRRRCRRRSAASRSTAPAGAAGARAARRRSREWAVIGLGHSSEVVAAPAPTHHRPVIAHRPTDASRMAAARNAAVDAAEVKFVRRAIGGMNTRATSLTESGAANQRRRTEVRRSSGSLRQHLVQRRRAADHLERVMADMVRRHVLLDQLLADQAVGQAFLEVAEEQLGLPLVGMVLVVAEHARTRRTACGGCGSAASPGSAGCSRPG